MLNLAGVLDFTQRDEIVLIEQRLFIFSHKLFAIPKFRGNNSVLKYGTG